MSVGRSLQYEHSKPVVTPSTSLKLKYTLTACNAATLVTHMPFVCLGCFSVQEEGADAQPSAAVASLQRDLSAVRFKRALKVGAAVQNVMDALICINDLRGEGLPGLQIRSQICMLVGALICSTRLQVVAAGHTMMLCAGGDIPGGTGQFALCWDHYPDVALCVFDGLVLACYVPSCRRQGPHHF